MSDFEMRIGFPLGNLPGSVTVSSGDVADIARAFAVVATGAPGALVVLVTSTCTLCVVVDASVDGVAESSIAELIVIAPAAVASMLVNDAVLVAGGGGTSVDALSSLASESASAVAVAASTTLVTDVVIGGTCIVAKSLDAASPVKLVVVK